MVRCLVIERREVDFGLGHVADRLAVDDVLQLEIAWRRNPEEGGYRWPGIVQAASPLDAGGKPSTLVTAGGTCRAIEFFLILKL